MNTVLDPLFLRRPKIDYLSPGICEAIFSSTGSPIIILPDFARHRGPTGLVITGPRGHRRLTWDVYPNAICYNVYMADCVEGVDPLLLPYHLIADCISVNFLDLDGEGCYRVSAVLMDGESDLSDPICSCESPPVPPVNKQTPTLSMAICGLLSWTVTGTQPVDAVVERSSDGISWSPATSALWSAGSVEVGTDFQYRVTGYTLGVAITNPSNVIALALHATAVDWADRVEGNGAPRPALATIRAQSDFCCYLDRNDLRSQILVFNSFVPDSFIAATTPLFTSVTDPSLDPWIPSFFVDADLDINGLKGNDSNKFLRTGFNPSTDFPDNISASVFVYETTTDLSGGTFGVPMGSGFAGREMALYTEHNLGHVFTCWDTAGSGVVAPDPVPSAGFVVGTRNGVNSNSIYFANSSTPWSAIGFNAAATTQPTSLYEIYVFAYNDPLGTQYFCPRRISIAGIGFGLSSAQGELLYNGCQALRIALGGGFI